MPRELYAIRHTSQAGRSGTSEEGGKVAAGVVPKSYSNVLSSECRGKLETILGTSNTSLEESGDRIGKKGDGRGVARGKDRLFEGWGERPKNIIHYL